MKALIATVVVAGLGAVGGAIYLGASLKEPTVVADPYQAGLHYDEHRHAAAQAATASKPAPPPATSAPTATASAPTATSTSKPTSTSHGSSTATATPTVCDLRGGPCTQPLPGGGEVTLAVGPRPLRAMRDLEFTARFRPATAAAGADVAVVLTMPGMYMGETRARLTRAGEGVFRGTGVVVRCPSGRRDWSAEVRVGGTEPGAQSRIARFALTVAE